MATILGSVADFRRLPLKAPTSQFNLKNVNGLKLWLRGDLASSLVITSSPKVDSWTDQSVSALLFEQATASLKPETGNTMGGRNVISSDGVDDVLKEVATPFSGTMGSAFMAVRIPTSVPSQNGNIIACGNASSGTQYWSPLRYDFQASKLWFGVAARSSASVNQVYGSTTEIAANTTYIVETHSDDSAWTMKVNGLTQTMTGIVGSNNGWWGGDVGSMNNVTIFDMDISGGAANSKVWLGEAAIFDGVALSEATRTKIRRYLATRWGATLVA